MEEKNMELIYPAYSKHNFYFRAHISRFILDKGCVPLNPFMLFDYFLTDVIDRDIIRNANNNVVRKADKLWVFGQIADGVLNEIRIAKKLNKPIKYFEIINSKGIREISKGEVRFEEDLEKYVSEL